MSESIMQWVTELLWPIITALLLPILHQGVATIKEYVTKTIEVAETKLSITVEQEARHRIYGAIDTAADLVVVALQELKDETQKNVESPTAKEMITNGIGHIREAMTDSLAILPTSDSALSKLIKRSAADKLRWVNEVHAGREGRPGEPTEPVVDSDYGEDDEGA